MPGAIAELAYNLGSNPHLRSFGVPWCHVCPVSVENPRRDRAMRVAGRLAAEVLDFIAPARQARRHHRRAERSVPRLHGRRAGHHAGATQLRAAGLQAVSQVDLHLGEPPGLPRRAGRQGAESRRHPEHRHHGDQGRLPRRHQPHVLRRRALHPGAAPVSKSPTNACGSASARCVPGAHLGDIGSAIQSHAEKHGFSVVREFCGHGIGRKFHEEPQVLHYGTPGHRARAGAGHDLHRRADDQRRQAATSASSPTAGPSSPRTTACPRNGSTPCSSPRTAMKC